jgi:hypothetical protein
MFIKTRRRRTENRRVYGIHEKSSTATTPLSRGKNIYSGTRRWLVIVVLAIASLTLAPPSEAVVAYKSEITRDVWPTQPHGERIYHLPAFQSLLERFEEQPEHQIRIRFPAGGAGKKWAEQVMEWLISFGIPGRYIEIIPGSGAPNRIVINHIIRNK